MIKVHSPVRVWLSTICTRLATLGLLDDPLDFSSDLYLILSNSGTLTQLAVPHEVLTPPVKLTFGLSLSASRAILGALSFRYTGDNYTNELSPKVSEDKRVKDKGTLLNTTREAFTSRQDLPLQSSRA